MEIRRRAILAASAALVVGCSNPILSSVTLPEVQAYVKDLLGAASGWAATLTGTAQAAYQAFAATAKVFLGLGSLSGNWQSIAQAVLTAIQNMLMSLPASILSGGTSAEIALVLAFIAALIGNLPAPASGGPALNTPRLHGLALSRH